MSGFFEICVRCRQTFTNERKYAEHMRQHTNRRNTERKPIDEVEERIKLEASVIPCTTEVKNEDERLSAVRSTSMKKKKLIAAGIEAATMTQQETESRYAEEKKKGTVK